MNSRKLVCINFSFFRSMQYAHFSFNESSIINLFIKKYLRDLEQIHKYIKKFIKILKVHELKSIFLTLCMALAALNHFAKKEGFHLIISFSFLWFIYLFANFFTLCTLIWNIFSFSQCTFFVQNKKCDCPPKELVRASAKLYGHEKKYLI